MPDDYPQPLIERVVKLESDQGHIRRKVDEIHDVLVNNGLIASVSKNTAFCKSWRWFGRVVIVMLVTMVLPSLCWGVWYIATHYPGMTGQ